MKAVLALVLMVFLQLPGSAQQFAQPISDQPYRDQNVMAGLLKIVTAKPDIQTAQAGNKLDFAPTASRGGNGSPFHTNLGCYIGSSGDFEFKSGYKGVDAQTMAGWAYDLHQHVVNAGGGYENFLKYQKEQSGQANNLLNQSLGGGGPDAWDKSMIAYAKLYEWSQTYWDHYSDKFRHTPSMFRDWWTNDAILDGMNIYMEYQERIAGYGTADFVAYKDGVLASLMKKK